MRPNRCGQCGAELRLGPASCPLCGAEFGSRGDATDKPVEPATVDEYQNNVRDLREQLRKLRDGRAKAV